MSKNPVNWFEIPVLDYDRAKQFYSKLLGMELSDLPMPGSQMAAFPMAQGDENATGALVKADNYQPSVSGTVVYFSCDDVDIPLKKVEELGGKVLIPKTSIGEHGFFGHIIDSEGNRVALHSNK